LKNLAVKIWGKITPLRNYMIKNWFTIILYHKIKPDLFENHVKYLEKHYTITDLDNLLNYYKSGVPLPPKSLFITFDDGWKSNYELLSVIERNKVHVTIFLTLDLVGTNKKPVPISNYLDIDIDATSIKYPEEPHRTMLTIEEIKEMSKIINFQSHGVTHHLSTILTEEQFKSELSESKKSIEQMTGKPVYAFAYPYNRVNEKMAQIIESCGYVFARAGGRTMNNSNTNRYFLNCIGIEETSTITELKKTLLKAELKTLF
jgi:peptidoglycan/xylan/chitin deacetylase (PgdA/CDA1 family)